MTRHQPTGEFGPGLALASTTMLLWGALPLILEGVLRALDPVTITWFRFTFASVVLGLVLGWRGALPSLRSLGRRRFALLIVATLFLAANYLAYLLGLERTDAPTAQVLIQAAPLLLAVGGIFVFHERFERLQWIGLAVLVLGMGGFFAGQLRTLVEGIDRYIAGVGWIGVAAVTWAVYGLAQKQLLLWLSSQGIMLCIYVGSALVFAFGARPTALAGLEGLEWTLLVFASANTLLAYGTFAAALEHWEASRVSAVIALTPLATLLFAAAGSALWPGHVDARAVGPGAFVGAAVVVAGSLLVALGQRATPRPTREDGSG